jgi:integrase
VSLLHAGGSSRETIRKSIVALAQVFDHAGIAPNPARDRVHVRLPREKRAELNPPTGEHVRAVHRLLSPRYRLPLLVLDATGMRLEELEALTWGDVDEARLRWRISQAVSKTGRARWVPVPPPILAAVLDLVARDDRTAERRVFQDFGSDRFRTAIARACRAAGVPMFSPHDLRHRRISLCTWLASPGRESASTSGSAISRSPRTRTRTFSPTRTSSTILNARLSAGVFAWCRPRCRTQGNKTGL